MRAMDRQATLTLYADEDTYQITVPPEVLEEGEDFFAKMDSDMDRGWKMGPTYVENPDQVMRAQIVAARLISAVENENHTLASLLAGYIVTRLPGTTAVRVDMQGDMLNTEIIREG